MVARQRGWIGIDFGARAIKMAQVERSSVGLRLVGCRVISRVAAEDELPAADAWWDAAFRNVRNGLKGRLAACVLPAARGELHPMNLPDGAVAERRAMIAAELEALSPTSSPRAFDYWDSRPPAGASDSSLENVTVLSAAEEEAIALASRVERAGLHCEAIDGLPLALARAVRMTPSGGPAAAVDWGHRTATFCIVSEGRPVFTRQLRDCGFAALPAALAEALGLSSDDAEQLLETYGLPHGEPAHDPAREVQEVIADAVARPLGEMVSQLNKTLAYPELRRSKILPEGLWLFGGGATVKHIGAHLSARVGVPAREWRLPECERPSAPWPLLGTAIALSALAWET